MSEKDNRKHDGGCRHRVWRWHDGGPDWGCSKQGDNWCCVDRFSDSYEDESCRHMKDDEDSKK